MDLKRDIFHLVKSRLRSSAKFRALSPSEKWYWLELCMFLDDQEEAGVSRWSLDRIARALNAPLAAYKSLIEQECLRGADAGEECKPITHVDRRGEEHTLIPAQMGPIWYSSAIVRDDYLRAVASKSGKRGGGNPALKKRIGDTYKGADKGGDIGVVKGADKGVNGAPSPAPSLSPTPPISIPTPTPGEVSPDPSSPLAAGKAVKRGKNQPKPEPVWSEAFTKFWEAWPRSARKRDSRDCAEFWNKTGLDNVASQVMDGLEKWKRSAAWLRNGGEFIEAPLVWLHKLRWRDGDSILLGIQRNGDRNGRHSEFIGARRDVPTL